MDNNELYDILKTAFNNEYTEKTAKAVFLKKLSDTGTLKTYNKNTQICHSGISLDKIYLMLTGKCHAVKFSSDGRSVIADTLEPVQLFGLYEMLSNTGVYNATVTAVNTSVMIEFPAKKFYEALKSDMKIAMMMLSYLAEMTKHSLERTNSTLFHTSYENLCIYIYNSCSGKAMPYKLITERKTIAEELNINLRTLYRYIDKLKSEGHISIDRGKLVINEKQYKALSELVEK